MGGNPTSEQWRPAVGLEGLIEVSTLGRVRSVAKLDALGRHIRSKILVNGHARRDELPREGSGPSVSVQGEEEVRSEGEGLVGEAESSLEAEARGGSQVAQRRRGHDMEKVNAGDKLIRLQTRRRRSKMRREMDAMREFCRAVEKMDENSRRANIYYLADKFLGIRLWGQRWRQAR